VSLVDNRRALIEAAIFGAIRMNRRVAVDRQKCAGAATQAIQKKEFEMKMNNACRSLGAWTLCLGVALTQLTSLAQPVFPSWDPDEPGDEPVGGYIGGPLTGVGQAAYAARVTYITSSDRTTHEDIARWTHCGGWENIGYVAYRDATRNESVNAIVGQGNYIYVAGDFSGIDVAAINVAKFDITQGTWSAVANWPAPPDWIPSALAVDANGTVYLGGTSGSGSNPQVELVKVAPDGTVVPITGLTSSEVGINGLSTAIVEALAVDGTDLYVGGRFTAGNGVVSHNFIKWNGTTWVAMGSGIQDSAPEPDLHINSIAVSGTKVFVAGSFANADNFENATICGLAMFSTSGTPLAAGKLGWDYGETGQIRGKGLSLAAKNGEVYLGGSFNRLGGVPFNGVARWTGDWTTMGTGVRAFVDGEHGNYAAGDAGTARWLGVDTVDGVHNVLYAAGYVSGSGGGDFDLADDHVVVNGPFVRWMTADDPNLACAQLTNPVRCGDAFSFTITGPVGSRWTVEATLTPNDPNSWGSMQKITLWNGSAAFTDPNSTGNFYQPDVYYRVRNSCCTSATMKGFHLIPAAWWPGDDNANDISGNNNVGFLENTANFGVGYVGDAFNLDGTLGCVVANASPSLNVGQTTGFTIEAWINPTVITASLPIAEYERCLGTQVGADVGVHLWGSAGGVAGCLYANIKDTSGGDHIVVTPNAVLTAGVWQHVAVSYDRIAGTVTLFRNGVALLTQSIGTFAPQTSWKLVLGGRTTFGNLPNPRNVFRGKLDEISVYNYPMGTLELESIYRMGAGGKCRPTYNPPTCSAPSAGMLAWWRAEFDGSDAIACSTASAKNGAGFGPGQVGTWAMYLDGINDYFLVNQTPNLFVLGSAGLTVEGWILPMSGTAPMPIAQFERVLGSMSATDVGVQFWISFGGASGSLYANLKDIGAVSHPITSPSGLLVPNAWQHVAVTYNRLTGVATLYINGNQVASQNLGSFTPRTNYNLLLGAQTFTGTATAPNKVFNGGLDELSVYSRALSAAEIQSIVSAGYDGKCH
jgi:hypothetical protein